MKVNETFFINIDELGLSQIYINQEKLHNILAWFDPLKINECEPLPVYDFLENGKYVLTDGHTRAYILYKSGADKIPVMIDNDKIVTCNLGKKLYKEYIEWCKRFCINTVKDFDHRIISNNYYELLWIERCDRLYNLFIAMETGLITLNDYEDLKKIGENKKLILYGANENVSCYYYEDILGNLWTYNDREPLKFIENNISTHSL